MSWESTVHRDKQAAWCCVCPDKSATQNTYSCKYKAWQPSLPTECFREDSDPKSWWPPLISGRTGMNMEAVVRATTQTRARHLYLVINNCYLMEPVGIWCACYDISLTMHLFNISDYFWRIWNKWCKGDERANWQVPIYSKKLQGNPCSQDESLPTAETSSYSGNRIQRKCLTLGSGKAPQILL